VNERELEGSLDETGGGTTGMICAMETQIEHIAEMILGMKALIDHLQSCNAALETENQALRLEVDELYMTIDTLSGNHIYLHRWA
jgi:regulator of replication initiation timing